MFYSVICELNIYFPGNIELSCMIILLEMYPYIYNFNAYLSTYFHII